MRTCFLHIGSEKTGTTSIQWFLAHNRDALLVDGVWYPRSAAYKKKHVHRRLSDAGLHDAIEQDHELAADFAKELEAARRAGARIAVISSEFFHSRYRKAEQIERLRSFLAPHFEEIRVVYYARRQDSLAVSMHAMSVRGGHAASRSPLLVYENKGHHYFDHLGVCDLWAASFGRDKLVTRIYDRSKLADGDVISDFARIVGLQKPYERKSHPANEALPTECMLVLLRFNASPDAEDLSLRKQLVAIGRERGGERVPMFTRSEAQAFLQRFEAGNKEFFAKYVDPSLGSDFDGGFDAYPEATPELTGSEIVETFFSEAARRVADRVRPGKKGRKKKGSKKRRRHQERQQDQDFDET